MGRRTRHGRWVAHRLPIIQITDDEADTWWANLEHWGFGAPMSPCKGVQLFFRPGTRKAAWMLNISIGGGKCLTFLFDEGRDALEYAARIGIPLNHAASLAAITKNLNTPRRH